MNPDEKPQILHNKFHNAYFRIPYAIFLTSMMHVTCNEEKICYFQDVYDVQPHCSVMILNCLVDKITPAVLEHKCIMSKWFLMAFYVLHFSMMLDAFSKC